jgi:hypothetical protein
MGVYTQYRDGYKLEAIYGTSTITTASDTAYLIGVLSKRSRHPSPKAVVHHGPCAVGYRETAYTWKGKMDCMGAYSIVMQNGIPIWMVMGKSSTAGGGPYTHTITPPTDGSANPSFTWHHERTGTATDWAVQFTGCKVASLSLICSSEGHYLIGAMNTVAQKAVDPNLDGTNAMLDTDPALPPTATTAPYKFVGMTRTWDYGSANTALNGLVEMELNISPDLNMIHTANWTAGVWTGQWPYLILDGAPMKYDLTMHLIPESDDVWDESVTLSNTKELYLKWAKSTNDYIAATLTKCQVAYHEISTPDIEGDEIDVMEITIVPESISFSVVDSIAGGHYGE